MFWGRAAIFEIVVRGVVGGKGQVVKVTNEGRCTLIKYLGERQWQSGQERANAGKESLRVDEEI